MFDPFNSRKCRDIRNSLSESLIQAITHGSRETVESRVRQFLGVEKEKEIRDYIQDRYKRYQTVLKQIHMEKRASTDTIQITGLLWNQELFFEVHEWLEQSWAESKDEKRNLYQALIRAAGVYIMSEAGRLESAGKLAGKAVAVLQESKHMFPDDLAIENLIEKLKHLDPKPPRL